MKKTRPNSIIHLPDGRTAVSALLACWLVLLAVGCAKPVVQPASRSAIFWPAPPEIKRIAFVNAISKPQDLSIRPSLFKRWVDYVGGRAAPAIGSPYGIATDSEGRLYVVDTALKQVHVFDIRGNRYSVFPADKTLLASPIGIAIDENDAIYVTDSARGAVYLFKDRGRKFITRFGQEVLKRPTGIALNPAASELLVVDTVASRVLRFDRSTRRVKGFLADDAGPKRGSGFQSAMGGGFHAPTQIALTPAGDILVCDALNFRIQVFSPQGRHLLQIGRMGDVPGTFSRPKGVAADSDGNIYVVDALFDNIQVFDRFGRLLMAFGDHGSDLGQFWLPTGIHIDKNDLIYVSDTSNRRVQIFKYLKEK